MLDAGYSVTARGNAQDDEEMTTKDTFGNQGANTARRDPSWLAAGNSVRKQIDTLCDTARGDGRNQEIAFLRHLMLYSDTNESRQMEEKITVADRNERCVRRAMYLMLMAVALVMTGFGYSVILMDDFFESRFEWMIRALSAVGLASLISFMAFLGIWLFTRTVLNDQRDACRRLILRTVDSRLARPEK